MRTPILLAVLGTAVALPPAASAQTTAGVGFPIGEKSRLHTNLDLAAGYDSNPERFPDSSTGEKSDWKAIIRPGIVVDVPGNTLNLNLKGQLSISQFFGTGLEKDTTFGALIGTKLRLGSPDSVASFAIEDQLVRTPTYIDDLGTVAADERHFKEWSNKGSAILTLRPGGGALSFDLGYTNQLSIYDVILPASQRHGGLIEAKLRFLPKTAVVFHTDFSFFSADQEGGTQTNDATPYNITLGLIGQVTTRISANLAVGFGDTLSWENGFFDGLSDSGNERNLIATAEFTYDLFESSRITAGYKRQVHPIIVLDAYRSDAPYLRFVIGIGPRLSFSVYGEYEFRSYSTSNRSVQIITGDARVDYWFFEFLTASLNYRVLAQNADEGTPASASEGFLLEDYQRHEALIGLGLRY